MYVDEKKLRHALSHAYVRGLTNGGDYVISKHFGIPFDPYSDEEEQKVINDALKILK